MSFPVKKLRESLDDDDVSDDVDDEVFIRDGRTFKLDDDRGLKRPLMAPRRKFKTTSSYFSYGESSTLRRLRAPFCVTLLCLIILCCLIALALILINMNTSYMLNKLMHPSRKSNNQDFIKPCTDFEIEEVWHYTIPKIKSETPVRSVEINGDGIDDVIVGYETGADHADLPFFTCQMYFGMPAPCGGGVLALDGKTGDLLWQRWMQTSILKLDCSYDVTQDDVNDCLVSGESGLLCIVNGKTGEVTWCLVHNEGSLFRSGILDFYAGQFIPDVNGDGVVDVITAHTNGSSAAMMGSHVAILSGHSGEILHTLTSPVSGEMMLSAPHLLVKPDGETVVIFCTVHNNAPTSIYVIALSGLINGESNRVKTIFSDIQGLAASPILIDMNDDQTEDIVVTSKSKLLIFNGMNYSLILNVSYPFDDSYEHDIQFSPVPGYFNKDSIPDFFLTYSVGSTEFLYYSVSTVLDGKTGKSLLPAPIVRSNIADTAGITLSSPGYGNDAFIYWMSSCVNFETNQDDYKLSGRSFEVDICNARFNTSTEIKLMLLSQHVPSPGIVLYSSSKNFESEINGTANVLGQVEEYIKLHPDVKKDIEMYQMSKLNNSPAKCTAALAAIQRNEASGYYVPNPFDPEIIPDPVQRAYDMTRDRYPAGDPLNVEPEYLPPDEDRDRDERDEPTKSEDLDTNQPTLSDNNQSAEEKDPSSTEIEFSANDRHDLSNTPERTRNVVKEVKDKSKLSKEVMPRKKRNSHKIVPRRKRKIGNIEIDTHIDNNDGISYYQDDFIESDTNSIDSLESRANKWENSMKEQEKDWESVQNKPERNVDNDHGRFNDIDYTTKLDSDQNNERNYNIKHNELATKIGATETDDENHGAEEFDDYEMEDRNNVETKETNQDDIENHGGETIDDYGEYKEQETRGENKIRHEQKYRNRSREMREGKATSITEKSKEADIETNDNGADIQTENNQEEYHNERYSDKQKIKRKDLINLESGNRMKRHKGRESEYDESEEDDADDEEENDNDEEEEEESDEEDQDDTEVEIEDEIQNKEQEEEDEREGNYDNDEEEEDDGEEDSDETEREDDEDDREETENPRQRDELTAIHNNHNDEIINSEKVLNRNKRNIQSTRISENYPRYKYYHGPNHKKKISMQEKWWKYIMMSNSEDWQMKKKSLQREENKLKEEKRKLEERQGNMDYMQNKTKELEKRNKELKEEEETLMKHIPSKKMINLDEQFLNYVKKSLGLKNNDSSISNYDVDDVEQLWDDFIEINVLNHKTFDDDYEFDNLVKDKDNWKKNKHEIHNSFDESKNNIYHYDNPKQMVSYNLHADHNEAKVSNNSAQKAKLTSTINHTTSNLESNNVGHIVDEMDLQQKFKHFNTLDQLKLINRINKNNKTKQNLMVKNNFEHSGSGGNKGTKSSNAKKEIENITSNYKNLKVVLKNGENFKYNDYYKWKDNSEYVNFDSYYNILKINGDDSNERESNELNGKKKESPHNVTAKHTIESPSKLFSVHKNHSLNCNTYFFKRRLECENKLKNKPQTGSTKNKHSTKKQKYSIKLPKKLHEKIQGHLGIKHIVLNDTKTDSKGRAIVIEKMNYKFPFNFGKEKIYSEKDLEFIFNNETHAEIKKIMKMNMNKINGSILKMRGDSHNKSEHHHLSHDVNYYKSHKLIRSDDMYDRHLNHTRDSYKTNKTTREMWFNTLHSLKNNKQFLKHIKSTHKTNGAPPSRQHDSDSPFDSEGDYHSNNLTPGRNTDLITKKIDLQNNIEKIQISELKNSKNKTHKLFPYRRRDKVDQQDKTNNVNRVENLFGLTDSMMNVANQTSLRVNKTENHILGLPVGGKYASRANWHEKSQYGLPLRKWETATEILANSQRKHRLMKVKKRSIQDDEQGINSKSSLKLDKRATVKKDLSESSIVYLKTNQTDSSVNTSLHNTKSNSESVNKSSEQGDLGTNPYEDIGFVSNFSSTNKNTKNNQTMNSSKTFYYTETEHAGYKSDPKPDNIVKRSIDKYLKILPRASSTPILTNSLGTNDSSSIDIIFVSFWVPPKTDIKKLSKSQLECVRQKVLRAKSLDCYNEFDDLLIEEEMAKQCLSMDDPSDTRGDGQFNLYYYQDDSRFQFFNPFNLRFGQLSVYRIRIKCKQCQGNVFEMLQNQGWSSGNGQMSNGVFVKKPPNGK